MTGPIVVATEPLSSGEAFGELGAAAAGDVDRRERLVFVGGDEGRDAAPVGGEDRVGRRAVGDLAQLVGAARADLLHPEPLVAAEEQHAAHPGATSSTKDEPAPATSTRTLLPLRRIVKMSA